MFLYLPAFCPDLASLHHDLTEDDKLSILTKTIRRPPEYPTTNKRKYNVAWESQYDWIRYSESRDAIYCGPCFIFAKDSNKHTKWEFIDQPYRDWKNAVGAKRGALPRHNCSYSHLQAVTASSLFLKICGGKQPSIRQTLSESYSQKVNKNTDILLSIIDVIIQLSLRGIPLRGSWIKGEAREDGNFNHFLQWKSNFNKTLSEHLKSGPKNAQYVSPQIQNELITCIGNYIREYIVTEVSKANFFSIMADETTDAAIVEQMSLCVRYVSEKAEVKEEFLGFVDLPKTDAKTITDTMISTLKDYNLDLTKWRGKGFDGAATMSGVLNGVQARITKHFPNAKYFTHCKSHCLNLVVVASCSKLPQINNFMTVFQKLSFFFQNSAKRKTILKNRMSDAVSQLLADLPDNISDENESIIFQSAARRVSLPTLSDTRWLSRIDSISTLLVYYDKIYDALSDIKDESTGQSSADATSYLHAMENFEFIFVATMTQYILSFIRPLSKNLQATDCDLLYAHKEAGHLITIFSNIRSENDSETFSKLYIRAEKMAYKIEVVPEKPRTAGRQRHRANAGENLSTQEYFKINHFFPFVDHIISHMTSRFPKELDNVLTGSLLVPGHHVHLNTDLEEKIFNEYEPNLPFPGQFESELIRWKLENSKVSTPMTLVDGLKVCKENFYPNINNILKLLLTLPVGSCSCERSFSALRRLKTWSRTTMKGERLNGLALLYVHRDTYPLNLKDILKKWDASGHRRIALVFEK